MERVKIKISGDPQFEIMLQVRVSDLNYGNHLGNDAVLKLCHEARVHYLKFLGHSEKEFMGQGLIMGDAAICFKAQAYLGDKLKVRVFFRDPGPYGFDLKYLILRGKDEIARVKTGMIFFDYDLNRIAKSPLNEDKINELTSTRVASL